MTNDDYLGTEMKTVRKTITVTKQQNEWIKAQIESGNFTNDSEYIRDLVRKDQTQSSEIDAIRRELIQGEQSGEPRQFDIDLFKQRMIAEHVKKTD